MANVGRVCVVGAGPAGLSLARALLAHGIPFDVGRVPGGLALRSRPGDRRSVELAGRAVLDAMRLVRASGRRLDDFTLDGVAQAILGEGKTVSARGAQTRNSVSPGASGRAPRSMAASTREPWLRRSRASTLL